MREAEFTARLRTHLLPKLYVLKLNVRYYRGVPDCYYSGSKADLWNEHKYLQKVPTVVETDKLLSDLQRLWLVGRHNEGRNVGVIIGVKSGRTSHGLFLPGVDWLKPITRDEFITRTRTYEELADELITRLGELKDPPLP